MDGSADAVPASPPHRRPRNSAVRRWTTWLRHGSSMRWSSGADRRDWRSVTSWQQQRNFVILDAHARVGDAWRTRWEGLRLFTPGRLNSLPGMPFPGDPHGFPTKDEVADYLEAYAATMELPVRTGVRVTDVWPADDGRGFRIATEDGDYEAGQVVVATGAYDRPRVPDFAGDLDPAITQLHSSQFRSTSQLRDGAVLVVGASNSGAEIALMAAREHPTDAGGPRCRQDAIPARGSAGSHVRHVLLVLRQPRRHARQSDRPQGGARHSPSRPAPRPRAPIGPPCCRR